LEPGAEYYECNPIGLNRLIDVLAENRHCRTFVQASTSSVYGEIAIGDETGEINPISSHGISKMAAEKLIEVYSKLTNIDSRILRLFSVYGPNQRPDMAYSKIIESIRNNSGFHIYGSGEQFRSNTYIDDGIDMIVSAIQVNVCPKIINICGDETRSLLDVIAMIESIMKRKAKIRSFAI